MRYIITFTPNCGQKQVIVDNCSFNTSYCRAEIDGKIIIYPIHNIISIEELRD